MRSLTDGLRPDPLAVTADGQGARIPSRTVDRRNSWKGNTG
jgi:hypothetical protein